MVCNQAEKMRRLTEGNDAELSKHIEEHIADCEAELDDGCTGEVSFINQRYAYIQ